MLFALVRLGESRNLPWFLPGFAICVAIAVAAGGWTCRALALRRAVAVALIVSLGLILAATLTPQWEALAFGTQGSGTCDLSRIGLARDLVRLSGRDPASQPMETVGLRPGEKLHEQLFYDAEDVEPTVNAKVLRALAPAPPEGVREDVRRLLAMATGEEEASLRLALLEYARQFGDAAPKAEADQQPSPLLVSVAHAARAMAGSEASSAFR